MFRSCQRSTCHRPAAATLTFRYDSAEVRLDDLQREAHPQRWELCPTHAARLTVPRGWAFHDERSPEPVAAGEFTGVAGHGESPGNSRGRGVAGEGRVGERAQRQARTGSPGQSGTGCASGSRYAALQAELPRLAAEFARGREWPVAEPGLGDDGTQDRLRHPQSSPAGQGGLDERSPAAAEPRSSRDLIGLQPGDIPRDPRFP